MTGAALLCAAAVAAASSLPADVADEAEAIVRAALPPGWDLVAREPDVVPTGWLGEPRAILFRLEDRTISYPHEGGFSYRPFWKLWLVPRDWEGRMEVMPIDPEAPAALFLGENGRYRALARSLGRNDWPDGARVLGEALGLETLPLRPRPAHTVDASAMQRLYQRLDFATGGRAERWHRQIYGIAELPDLVYVELLTWEDRPHGADRDPTSLGSLAEAETQFVTREVFAAFPEKRGLYLRRVTERSFADALRVRPDRAPDAGPEVGAAEPGGAPPDGERLLCDGS